MAAWEGVECKRPLGSYLGHETTTRAFKADRSDNDLFVKNSLVALPVSSRASLHKFLRNMIFTEKIAFPPVRSPFALLTDHMRYGGAVAALVLGFGLPRAAYGDDRPEPMVFDLIDPLGAKKGEAEINTLLDFSPRTGQLEWSPEIEYAFADDYAVEFELPLENVSVKEYKVSLQGTFGKLDRGRMIHGWQAIGRRKNEEKAYAAEVLYLNDYRFSSKWSMMNMFGVRHTAITKSGDVVGLLNNSVFYSIKENFSFGVELNSEISERRWRYRVTPQIQYDFGANGKGAIVHFGGGPSQLNRERTEWLITSRLIYSF